MNLLKKDSIILSSVLLASVFLGSLAFAGASSASTTQTNGTVTSCSGLLICSFTLTNSNGTGSASTSGSVGGYVGQNFTFSGSSVTYKLPGEQNTTYASGAYSGKATVAGWSNTAGTLYKVNGTFATVDVNTGKIVSGSTKVFVGVKGHSGRGGGITWTAVNGTIVFNKLNLDGTSSKLACSPSSISIGAQATCTMTVTDLNAKTGSTPTGTISFSNSDTILGSLSKNSCTLSSTTGSCSVNYTSNPEYGPGTSIISATYHGDKLHSTSTASYALAVTGSPPN